MLNKATDKARSSFSIDHVIYGARNLEEAASRLEQRYGLRFLPGGRHAGGTINMIAPLEPPQYFELLAVDEVLGDIAREAKRLIDAGKTLLGWAVATADIEAIAARVGAEPVRGSITRSDGTTGSWRHVCDPFAGGHPFFVEYPEEPEERRQRLARLRHEAGNDHVGGFTFVEVGGANHDLRELIGDAAMPIRLLDREPGLYAIGIAGPHGEIVIREGD
jgi:hypothetical protein